MRQRLSQAGLERLAAELDGRDRGILQMLGRLHLASGSHLLRVWWPEASESDRRAARRTLARLTKWRVVARLERRVGGVGRGSEAWTYALDVVGQRLWKQGGSARRPHLPRPAMWAHAMSVSEAYTRVAEALRQSPARLGAWQGEPESWRQYSGPYGEPLVIKPDGYVEIVGPGYADLFFLEIDVGTQSRSVIRSKLAAYRRYAASGAEQEREGVFPKVMFLTTSEERLETLVDVLGEQAAESWQLFGAGLVTDTARLLVGNGEAGT